ncbi:MAG TPA: IclR family transcriptional regulator [Devosiaceae bacterium]|jgi:DNA-binding IclR family transcriptional regulator
MDSSGNDQGGNEDRPEEKSSVLASVERALGILQTLGTSAEGLSAKDIMQETGLSRATAFRFLSVLSRKGFILKDSTSGLYLPGFALLGLATMAHRSRTLSMLALPTMRRCRDESNETVYLSVLANDHRVDIEQVEARMGDMIRVKQLGLPKPLYASGASRLLLAFSDDQFINKYLQITNLVPFSESTLTTPEQIRDSIRTIRKMGYSEGYNELNSGAASTSAPIFGHFGEIIAAITVTAQKPNDKPESREAIIKLVVAAGAEISERIKASAESAPAPRRSSSRAQS